MGLDRTPEDVDESEGADIDRRSLLQMTGAAAGASVVGLGATGTAAAWESDAETRIQEHRTGDLEITVEDGSGNTVPDATVEIEQQDHDFTFGTAVNAEFLYRAEQWGDPIEYQGVDGQQKTADEEDMETYRQYTEELFNTIVFENYTKWNIWENDWQNPDETAGNEVADWAVDWANERDMDVRGHVCVWGNVDAYGVPPDVAEAMGMGPNDTDFSHDDFSEADHDPQLIIDRTLGHIERIIDYYGESVMEWEIANEFINVPEMIYAVEGSGFDDSSVDQATAQVLGDWFEKAQEVTDKYDDIGIAVNEYNTLVGRIGKIEDQYEAAIDYLIEDRGIDLDGIGFQSHFGSWDTLTQDRFWQEFERFAGKGAGLRMSEFDMYKGNWSEQEQADFMYRALKIFFSHPAAEQFLVWNFWDPLHWGDDAGQEKDAPFFRADWSEKPALDVWRNLVFDEWWTAETGTADGSGVYSTSAFLGTHDVTVSANGTSATATVEVTDSDGTTSVSVSLDGSSTGDGPSWPNGATDPDGDGLYEDLSGDGTLNFPDVNELFQNTDQSVAQDNSQYYDFDGDGDLDSQDVLALFEMV
ncbi:endo-1,4-beta-xylanase [Halococcoides cellulosivorans]|uniref:endo-1,4-beta-xylanase n=1 Tax=Halococcoides cellulosivorans TaxID=1679096 RepID=A0A2R4WZI6_9EURY|nr:endo-1,4-beta-xylanase [Halococcoides cellulosivorans]AWB26958.1 hypothetical protein HARCEL1_04145 [Halococcoides cellulosivorans]